MHPTRPNNPFRLGLAQHVSSPLVRPFAKVCEKLIERAVLLSHLARSYDDVRATLSRECPPEVFAQKSLSALETQWRITQGSLDLIPKEGPVILVANHPFGAIEGVMLIELLARARKEYRILANHLLKRVDEFTDVFIAVDPFENSTAKRKNTKGIGECIAWLKSGGLLATFPSGTVSHLQLDSREVSDPEWNENIARIAKRTGATVVPLYFHGRNGWFFQLAGLIHPLLRTILIPREFYKKRGQSFDIRIGSPITPDRIESFSCSKELCNYFRLRTYLLGQDDNEEATVDERPSLVLEPVIPPVAKSLLRNEIALLEPSQMLHSCGAYEVYCGSADQLPFVLREIGRLREIAFRAANEGTGKSIDIDVFDNFYEHLFVWDSAKEAIVGAYRIAKADVVSARYGIKGLYTFSLFSYKESLLEQLGKSLEVGRSFINPEYQRDYKALLRLWEGIGRYVAKNPEYRTLFGPVSISSEYNAVSRQLIVDFLQLNHFKVNIAREIKARTPMNRMRIRGVGAEHVRVVKSLADVNELLREVKSTQSGLPVLLRQYLKLGAKVIGYNLDPDFSNVLDALIYVDLAETEPKLLTRYLGAAHAPIFRAIHTSVISDASSSKLSEVGESSSAQKSAAQKSIRESIRAPRSFEE